MGIRKVTVKRSVAQSIAAIALYIESKGMAATAEKFADEDEITICEFISSKMIYW